MKVQFVVHESFEAPGSCETWARSRGHEVAHARVYAGDRLPEAVDDLDLLIVMGGPQAPDTTTDQCPHFDAAAEQALIARCVGAGKAVLGVCLGAQLVGQALGAGYEHSPHQEIGLFPIVLTAEGLADPLLAGFGRGLDVGHWHADMPGLTDGATVLATSAGCPRQIVRYAGLVYGFQCHLEFTPDLIGPLIEAEPDLPSLAGQPYVQQPAALRANHWAAANEALDGFLDGLAARIG